MTSVGVSRTEWQRTEEQSYKQNYTLEWCTVLLWRIDSTLMMKEEPQEKTPAERNDVGVEYNFNKQSWLQLMCCTLVSGREMVVYFGVEGSRQKEILGK